jgi:hypothetical protein
MQSVTGSMMATVYSVLFHFLQASWVVQINSFSEKFPQKKRFGRVRSGNHGGQSPCPTMHSPKNSCSKAIFSMAINTVKHLTCQHCPTTDVFPIADTSSVPKFCYQPVYCCLVWYFLVRLRKAKCFMSSNFDVK